MNVIAVCYAVDGVWEQWTSWSNCDANCGGGTRQRTRECDGPYDGGDDCEGDAIQTEECNTEACPSKTLRLFLTLDYFLDICLASHKSDCRILTLHRDLIVARNALLRISVITYASLRCTYGALKSWYLNIAAMQYNRYFCSCLLLLSWQIDVASFRFFFFFFFFTLDVFDHTRFVLVLCHPCIRCMQRKAYGVMLWDVFDHYECFVLCVLCIHCMLGKAYGVMLWDVFDHYECFVLCVLCIHCMLGKAYGVIFSSQRLLSSSSSSSSSSRKRQLSFP